MAAPPNLQEAIDKAGSAVALLWKPSPDPWLPPVVEREYVGWAKEQTAGFEAVALSDLSFHMRDLFIEGPDAQRLLSDFSANNFEKFEIGQAKQFVPVTAQGNIFTDGILQHPEEGKFIVTGPPASQSWLMYNAEQGGYDVDLVDDPDREFRPDDPILARYQIQGPNALALAEKVFGAIPETKFFHSTPLTWNGRHYRALRHGMVGQPGFEFISEYKDGPPLRDALMEAGEEFGIVHVGALAYATNGVESGWIPSPVPGIYTDPELRPYREWLSVFSYEGQKPLHGTDFSEDIEHYYTNPWELGLGRSIAFNHDFHGRDALEKLKDTTTRTKVTLELDKSDVERVFGADPGWFLTYGRYRIEAGGEQVGTTFYTAHIDRLGLILALSLVEGEHAQPGTPVELVYGEHPGPGTPADADLGFERLRATVQPSPYNEFARTGYRKD